MGKTPLDVVVVGGSLGGLFAGIVLKRLGHNVCILERNPTPLLQHQGAGIVAGGDTQAFFGQYDTTRRPIAVPSNVRQYLDKEGNVIHEENSQQRMTSWDLLYYLLRANFDRTESEYVEKVPDPVEGEGEARYDYGRKVTNVKDLGDEVEVSWERTQSTNTQDDRIERSGTLKAALLIAADGPSSTIRQILLPAVKRKYVGYVAFRGTIPESSASPQAKSTFVETFSFFHSQHSGNDKTQILAYVIPGPNGSLSPGQRLINWVWYCNYPESSQDYADLMTDADGNHHHITLQVGKMRESIWEKQKTHADKTLPPQFAELVKKTEYPFVQSITDVIASQNSFLGGKVLLLGDALAGFRPHTAASTSQAAFDATVLGKMMRGAGDKEGLDWEHGLKQMMDFAKELQERGVWLGERSQFGRHPLARG